MIRRVWILSELYYPDEGATSTVLTQLAETLANCLAVNVLCGQPVDTTSRRRLPRRETQCGVSIQRCAGTQFNPERLWGRLVNACALSGTIAYAAWRCVQPGDVVLAVTNPPMLPWLAAVVCRLRRARGILLIHDLYPDVLVAVGLLPSGSWPVRALSWFNQWAYGQFARIVVLGRDMQARVAQSLSSGDTRVVCIPNWARDDMIRPLPREANPLLRRLGLSDKFVIQYSGNMGRTHGLADLLNAANQLNSAEDIHFLFIGSGSQRNWLARAIAESQATNITLLPTQPRDELSASLNGCDVAIVSLVSGMAGISVPSRIYNIMAAGKPVIAVTDLESELAQVVLEERIGWVVPPDRPGRLAEVILEARANPDCRAEMGLRARAAAENVYSFGKVTQAYARMLDELQEGP
jgi:colanic acid biosynthesis glycosyl transferase WcaI